MAGNGDKSMSISDKKFRVGDGHTVAVNNRSNALFLASLRFCVHYCIDRDTVQKKITALRAVFLL